MRRLSTLACILLWGVISCRKPKTAHPADALAKINAVYIQKADFDMDVERTMARYQLLNTQVSEEMKVRIKTATLSRLIDEALLMEQAQKLNITVSDQEINLLLEQHRARFGAPEKFRDFLNATKTTEQQVKQSLHMNLLRERVLERLVQNQATSDEDLKRYYQSHIAQYQEPEMVHVRHILAKIDLPKEETMPKSQQEREKVIAAAKAKARAKIEQAQKRIKAGEKFEAVAKAMTDDLGSKEKSGDLGYFPRGRMVQPFEDAAFALTQAGEVSKIVESEFGYHLLQFIERKAARDRGFEEIKETLKGQFLEEKKVSARDDALASLRKAAQIERFVSFDEKSKK